MIKLTTITFSLPGGPSIVGHPERFTYALLRELITIPVSRTIILTHWIITNISYNYNTA